jgi:hypothetical protein
MMDNKKLETKRIEMSDAKTIEIAMAAVRMYAEAHPRPPHVTQEQAVLTALNFRTNLASSF